MKSFKALITLVSNEEKTNFEIVVNYDINKKYLYYVENDVNKTVNIFDYERNILKRDNNTMYLEIEFNKNKNTKSRLFLKELNNYVDIDVETEFINIDDKFIEISYILNSEKYLYKIEKIKEIL